MIFTATFEVRPAGVFGVPDGDIKVLPTSPPGSPPSLLTTDSIDLRYLFKAGWGSMPVYRTPSEALSVELDVGGGHIAFKDNFATLTFEAADWQEAKMNSGPIFRKFLSSLTVLRGVSFSYRRLTLEGQDGQSFAYPAAAPFGMITYDIAQLRADILAAGALADVTDATLERAVHYLKHALYLYSRIAEWSIEYWSDQGNQFTSSILLNVWKSISTIVGDRSKRDNVNERCRRIGLPEAFYKTQVAPIQQARDNYDIAHYDLDPERVRQAQALVAKCSEVARRVIVAYANYIRGGGASFTPRSP